jgi:hypothetical protein
MRGAHRGGRAAPPFRIRGPRDERWFSLAIARPPSDLNTMPPAVSRTPATMANTENGGS